MTKSKSGQSNRLLLWSVFALAIAALLFVPVSAADVENTTPAVSAQTASAPAPCEVWVCPSYGPSTPGYGCDHFATIQEAVDAVAEYGIVHVGDATYYESVEITKCGVSVIADEGTVLDATGEPIGIYIHDAADVTVSGFTIINAEEVGILAEYADNVRITDNCIDLDVLFGDGIAVYCSDNAVISGNGITIDACAEAYGIYVDDSENPQVNCNAICINVIGSGNTVATEESIVSVLETGYKADHRSGMRSSEISAAVEQSCYAYAAGISVYGYSAVVEENVVDVTATCDVCVIGSFAGTVGIDVEGDFAEVSCNEITSTAAADYAYADGIYATGLKVLVDSNTIDSCTEAYAADPYGIDVWDAEKGQIVGNEICMKVFGVVATGYGINVDSAEKVQVIGNTVGIDACLESLVRNGVVDNLDAGCSAAFWMEGIYVCDSYQSQIAGNCVDMEANVAASSLNGAIAVGTSERAQVMDAMHAEVAGESVAEWSGTTGVDIDACGDADVHDNIISVDLCIEAADESEAFALAYGGIWAEGLSLWGGYDSDVYENSVTVLLDTEVASAAGDETGYANTVGLAATEVLGITLYDTYDTTVIGNCVDVGGSNAVIGVAVASYSGMTPDCLMARLAREGMFVQEQAMLVNESVNSIIGSTDAFATVRSSSAVIGVFADTCGNVEINDNAVDVCVDTAAVAASYAEVGIEDALAGQTGLGAGFGIIGPSGYSAVITGNDVSVSSALKAAAYAEEELVGTRDAVTTGLNGVAAVGITALAYINDISENTVDIDICGEYDGASIEGVPNEYSGAYGLLGSAGIGIVTLNTLDQIDIPVGQSTIEENYYQNTVKKNDVTVENCLSMNLYAEGIGDPVALAGGLGASVGIVAPRSSIHGNDVNVAACVEGATAETYEASALEVGSASGAAGLAVGIASINSLVTCNNVLADASANAAAIAETEALLENACGYALSAGLGIGILDHESAIEQNTVEGHGCAVAEAIAEGYRTDAASLAFSAGIGVFTYGGDVNFNDLVGSDDAGLFVVDSIALPTEVGAEDFDPTDATYNYYGAMSGPSGVGPGIGDAVYGTCTYEPWLTEPFAVVIGEQKAAFGFELKGEYDYYALEKGWNTLSTPISLVNSSWGSISKLGDGLDYCAAVTWDAEQQTWVQVIDSTEIGPLDAIFIKMIRDDRVPLAINPEITSPAVKCLKPGWNLIGPAYCLDQDCLLWETLPVDKTLISVAETPDGKIGYTLVVSPSVNEDCWVYTAGCDEAPTMDVGRGYWVFMKNCDTLAGFSSTPLNIPAVNLCC